MKEVYGGQIGMAKQVFTIRRSHDSHLITVRVRMFLMAHDPLSMMVHHPAHALLLYLQESCVFLHVEGKKP